jgi:hypothetical protein
VTEFPIAAMGSPNARERVKVVRRWIVAGGLALAGLLALSASFLPTIELPIYWVALVTAGTVLGPQMWLSYPSVARMLIGTSLGALGLALLASFGAWVWYPMFEWTPLSTLVAFAVLTALFILPGIGGGLARRRLEE